MDRFLVNMAIIKVNFEKSGTDILDNYMPLVSEALSNISSETFSTDDFKKELTKIAEFNIPTGAILSLLKRAEKKHKLLTKEKFGVYNINKSKLVESDLIQRRDSEQRKYNQLVNSFVDYCQKYHQLTITEEDASLYFFEILYDIAPSLFKSVSDIDKLIIDHSEKNKYLVAGFISHIDKFDQTSFEAVLSFVRGSMLTETFYYSNDINDTSNKRMSKVTVYLDTQFLVRLLGYSENSIAIPCHELVGMLKDLNVKYRCFRQTYDELYGIFFAASNNLITYGRLLPNKPGDVFDQLNQQNVSSSDLLVLLDTLEDELNKLGVYVEDKPEIIEAYSIDEADLSHELGAFFENQSEKARNHDIDCLSSIFQFREGRVQKYLESCKAIFITTNPQLARLSTIYFNKHYGHSNAPVCMSDHVFTSLIWMKGAKKTPNLPRDRIVANCYSALLPSESLWAEYISEVTKLKDKGTLSEHDYHVLIHSITAREHLMESSFSSGDNIFGSVDDILHKAKLAHTEEIGKELKITQEKSQVQSEKLENFIVKLARGGEKLFLFTSIATWIFILAYALIFSSPENINDVTSFSTNSLFFIGICIITILNLIFGFRLIDMCKNKAKNVGGWISRKMTEVLLT